MRKLLIALSAVVMTMTACQKELSLEQSGSTPGGGSGGTGGGNQTSGLLTRLVYAAGPDSTIKAYGYDAAKRLINYQLTSTRPEENDSRSVVRNSAGVITRFVVRNPDLLANGIDSIVRTPVFSSAQTRYTYSLGQTTIGSVPYIDSTAYSYDGAGNLASKTSFIRTAQSPYVPYLRYEYTFAGGNVASEKIYTASGANGAMQLENTYNYTYDSKVNPLKLGNEALILLDDASLYGNNNPATLSYVDPFDANENYNYTFTYNYNTTDKPVTGSAAVTPGPGSFDVRYYYN